MSFFPQVVGSAGETSLGMWIQQPRDGFGFGREDIAEEAPVSGDRDSKPSGIDALVRGYHDGDE